MTAPFPRTPTFTGFDAPSRVEANIYDLEIEGELPTAINGSWYRCGPDPQYPPHRGDDVYINGDGMVSMFRFEAGHVDFRSRYVRTARFEAERRARRSLFGDYRNPYTDDPSVAGLDRGAANTAPVWHGGRLLALKEDSLPYELDPHTLETKGVFDWDGRLRTRTVSAHPKIDTATGEMHFYGYEATGGVGREMAYCVADAHGTLLREDWFDAPYPAMVHDFAITAEHVIFPLFPTLADDDRMRAGGPHWMSDQSQDSYVGIMRRDGPASAMRWFRRPGGHAYHVINAFEADGLLHLDLAVSEINSFPFVPDVSGVAYDPRRAAPMPMRWSFDLSRNENAITERVIGSAPGDLPRIDDRRAGQDYRFFYMGMIDPSRAMLKAGPVGAGFNLVGQIDLATGHTAAYYGDDRTTFQEPQFVPCGAAENDGYVLSVMDRHDENRSDVGVFDARAFAAGPVAVIRLPLRLRSAFHGTWVAA